MHRRTFLPALAGAFASAAQAPAQKTTRKGRLKQSVTRGCFRGGKFEFEDMCREAARLGAVGFDLIGPDLFPVLKKHGLVPTMVPGGSTIPDGINRKENHSGIDQRMRAAIQAAADAGAPNVIALSGERKGMSDAEGADNSVAFLNNIKSFAEDKNITICMELLNSKVNHPDYMCDQTNVGRRSRASASVPPRFKLLYDIYHMQIMEGDVIRTMRDNIQCIAHFHTGGNPGRHEFDDTQEMNYRGIAKALVDLKFTGYVAHEYSPLGDPLKSLDEALSMCDV